METPSWARTPEQGPPVVANNPHGPMTDSVGETKPQPLPANNYPDGTLERHKMRAPCSGSPKDEHIYCRPYEVLHDERYGAACYGARPGIWFALCSSCEDGGAALVRDINRCESRIVGWACPFGLMACLRSCGFVYL